MGVSTAACYAAKSAHLRWAWRPTPTAWAPGNVLRPSGAAGRRAREGGSALRGKPRRFPPAAFPPSLGLTLLWQYPFPYTRATRARIKIPLYVLVMSYRISTPCRARSLSAVVFVSHVTPRIRTHEWAPNGISTTR